MKILTHDLEGNIVAIYPKDNNKDGVLIEDELVDKIMQSPLGYKVENGEVIETGYVTPDQNDKLTENEIIMLAIADLAEIVLGGIE